MTTTENSHGHRPTCTSQAYSAFSSFDHHVETAVQIRAASASDRSYPKQRRKRRRPVLPTIAPQARATGPTTSVSSADRPARRCCPPVGRSAMPHLQPRACACGAGMRFGASGMQPRAHAWGSDWRPRLFRWRAALFLTGSDDAPRHDLRGPTQATGPTGAYPRTLDNVAARGLEDPTSVAPGRGGSGAVSIVSG